MTQESPIPNAENESQLDAEALGAEFKHRSARSGVLMIVSYAIQLMVGICGTAVLARMLRPADFGYLGMAGTLLTFVVTIRGFLLSPAVHRQDLNQAQASGLFWLNVLASVMVAGGVALMAPVLAWFFHEPTLLSITLVLSVGVLVNMLGMLHYAMLSRKMRFDAICTIEIGATVFGVVVGITAARLGASYWALVYQQLAVWLWQTLFAWTLCPWRPTSYRASAFLADEGIRSMLRYGQAATASRVITFVSRNMDAVLVGRFMDAGTLGLYQKAYQWAMMPFWQIFIPMTPVAVASLSRLQDDPPRYRTYARMTFLGLFGMALPGTVLLMVEADAAIRILMGPNWSESVRLLRVLCIGGFFSSVTVVPGWLFLSEGRTTEQLKWALGSAPVMIVGVSIGLRWGAIGVAYGSAIATTLLAVPMIWYCLRRSPVTIGDFIESFWRPAAASIIAGGLLWLFKLAVPLGWHVFLELPFYSAIYGALYLICWLALPGGLANGKALLGFFRELRRGPSQ